MNRHRYRIFALASATAAALAVAVAPALAHHSFSMFDTTKASVMTGTVKELQWTNPHISLWVVRDGKPGAAPEVWNFEATSPGNLTRVGWTKRTFQPGDKIELNYFPLRNGQHGGAFIKATVTATGKVVSGGR